MRNWLLAFLVSASFTFVTAQNFDGGFYAGMTASQIDGDAMSGYDMAGLNIGAFTQLKISENSNFKVELAFIQKGSRDTIGSTRFKLTYVEIPLIYSFRWNFLSFEIGPALDILASSKDEGLGRTQYNQNDYRRFVLNGIVGVSYHFNDTWHINFRTNNSLTPITPPTLRPAESESFYQKIMGAGWRNVILSFGVNYTFTR